ncbi:MAG: AraC family transcriptional regulator [Pseudomonadota bacterium]|nr:AraC family transcriptional regulator [Pseudomonadota bacterium]
MPTSCSHYFIECVRGAERAGVDGNVLLDSVGLTRAEVEDPAWRGDVELLARMVRTVWRETDDEFMGYVDPPARPGTFAMMTHGIVHSPSLEHAVRRGVRFYDLMVPGLAMSVATGDTDVVLTVRFAHPERDPAGYFLDFWLTIWTRLVGWLAGEPALLLRARFAFPRPDRRAEEFRHMFRCGHVFEAEATALHFDRTFMQRPVVRTSAELKLFLAMAPSGFMSLPGEENTWSRRIRASLLNEGGLPLQFPAFDAVAARFGQTPATLRRKLVREGSSWRAIVESIRRDIAIRKIVESRMPMQDVAALLGYSEARAFTRAFRNWTGTSPAAYREGARRGDPAETSHAPGATAV